MKNNAGCATAKEKKERVIASKDSSPVTVKSSVMYTMRDTSIDGN